MQTGFVFPGARRRALMRREGMESTSVYTALSPGMNVLAAMQIRIEEHEVGVECGARKVDRHVCGRSAIKPENVGVRPFPVSEPESVSAMRRRCSSQLRRTQS